MVYQGLLAGAFFLVFSLPGLLSAQQDLAFHDPSPHKVQFVTVDTDVKLEVLDWGGSGRPLVFLAGLGNSAHVFDDFAPKLTSEYHVYGVTRRGFGASSAPASGYTADRLGDDVVAALDALKIGRPVLVGHSIAGEELSSVASRHPERVAGVIYLDAGYSYAYYDKAHGDLLIDFNGLQEKLTQLQPGQRPPDQQLVRELLEQHIPDFQRDLQEIQNDQPEPIPPLPPPTAQANSTFLAFQSWRDQVLGVTYPEAEFRQMFASRADGGVGDRRTAPSINAAILAGEQKYSDIRVPALAIYAEPHDPGPYVKANISPSALATVDAADSKSVEVQTKAFETGVPAARVVRLPHANHYLFLSNEADVLREMRAFLAGLP